MPETSSSTRWRAPSWIALGVMSLACLLIGTALFLVAYGAVA